MKKIKRFWQENSVLIVLSLIIIACLVAISVVVVTYFVGDSETKYGERLEGIEAHPFGEADIKELTSKLEEDDQINKTVVRASGKTIYVTIVFESKTTLVEAQSKALGTLDYFNEDILGFYDIEYLIRADSTEDSDGFQIMGSHNVNGTGGIVWNNNTPLKETEE